MAYNFGSSIVKNGLILALDSADQLSYISGSASWNDMSGNNNTCTFTTLPTFLTTNAGTLNRPRGTITDSSTVNSNEVTVSAWVLWNGTGFSSEGDTIVTRGVAATDSQGLQVGSGGWWLATGGFNFKCAYVTPTASQIVLTSSASWASNIWYNVAFTLTLSTGSMALYQNGSRVGNTGIGTVGAVISPSPVYVCRPVPTITRQDNFQGRISTVTMYNRVLSAAEISQNFNALRGRFGV